MLRASRLRVDPALIRRMLSAWRAHLRAFMRRWLGLRPKLPKSDRRLRIVMNGKVLARTDVQLAIEETRLAGLRVDVATTEGPGDATRLATVSNRLCDVVVAAGGDGTIQEVAAGLLRVKATRRPSLALLPVGTANDFATGCEVSRFPPEALHTAAVERSRSVDLMRVTGLDAPIGAPTSGREPAIAVNVITAAFIDEDAADVSDEVKRVLGGPAYWIAGIMRTLQMRPRRIAWRGDHEAGEDDLVVLTVANGRRTGGGSVVAPHALINDGRIDVRMIRAFDMVDLPTVVREVSDPFFENPRFVIRFQTRSVSLVGDSPWKLTLDGEPRFGTEVEVETLHKAIRLVLPPGAPVRPRGS